MVCRALHQITRSHLSCWESQLRRLIVYTPKRYDSRRLPPLSAAGRKSSPAFSGPFTGVTAGHGCPLGRGAAWSEAHQRAPDGRGLQLIGEALDLIAGRATVGIQDQVVSLVEAFAAAMHQALPAASDRIEGAVMPQATVGATVVMGPRAGTAAGFPRKRHAAIAPQGAERRAGGANDPFSIPPHPIDRHVRAALPGLPGFSFRTPFASLGHRHYPSRCCRPRNLFPRPRCRQTPRRRQLNSGPAAVSAHRRRGPGGLDGHT